MNNQQMGNIIADILGAQIEKMNSPEISLPPLPNQEAGGVNAPAMPTEMPFQQPPYSSTLEPMPQPSPPMYPESNMPPPLDMGVQQQLPSFTSMTQQAPDPNYNQDTTGASSLRNPIMPNPNAY